MKQIPYNKDLKDLSRELRNKATLSEVLLWKKLRAKQMKAYTFNRQKPLLNFIVDFYCKPLNLVIEIDGESHNSKYKQDIGRQKQLEAAGLQFLRFTDVEVKQDMNNVIRTIEHWIEENETK
jgi:very-short-patch-repair endonuclease